MLYILVSYVKNNTINDITNNTIIDKNSKVIIKDVLPIPDKNILYTYNIIIDSFDRDINVWQTINPFQINFVNTNVINSTFTNVENIKLLDILFPKYVMHPDNNILIDVLDVPYVILIIKEFDNILVTSNNNESNIFAYLYFEDHNCTLNKHGVSTSNYVRFVYRYEIKKHFIPTINLRTLTILFQFPDGNIISFPDNTQLSNPINYGKNYNDDSLYSQQLLLTFEINCSRPENIIPTPLIPS